MIMHMFLEQLDYIKKHVLKTEKFDLIEFLTTQPIEKHIMFLYGCGDNKIKYKKENIHEFDIYNTLLINLGHILFGEKDLYWEKSLGVTYDEQSERELHFGEDIKNLYMTELENRMNKL